MEFPEGNSRMFYTLRFCKETNRHEAGNSMNVDWSLKMLISQTSTLISAQSIFICLRKRSEDCYVWKLYKCLTRQRMSARMKGLLSLPTGVTWYIPSMTSCVSLNGENR